MRLNTRVSDEINTANTSETKKKSFKEHIAPALILAVASSFFICLYAPLEIYFSNKSDLWYDFYTVIGMNLAAFAAVAIVLFGVQALAFLIHPNVYKAVFLCGTVFYFVLYGEGTFFDKGLPMLDGREVSWALYSSHRYTSIGLAVGLIVIALVLLKIFKFKKLEKGIRFVLVCFSLMLLVTLVTVCIRNNGLTAKTRRVISKKNEFQFSTDRNMIIFMIDATDGDTFDKVLKDHPEYREEFKDFTYYSNMGATYTQTNYSVPHIMTGQWFETDDDYMKYLSESYDESPLMARLVSDGYRIGYYQPQFYPAESEMITNFENILTKKSHSPNVPAFLKAQLKLVGYRYAPFDLKRKCVVYPNRDFPVSDADVDVEGNYSEDNYDFYTDLQNANINCVDEPCFKYYHVEGAHVPFRYDKDMNIIENGTYSQNVEAAMTLSARLLDKLKEAGVYDNSTIIIMADHGFSEEDIPEDRLHSVFFVKGVGETGDTMSISDAPVSFEDLQTAFDRLLDGAESDAIFDWKEGDERDRRCFVYTYPELFRNVEAVQHGHSGDLSTLEFKEYKEYQRPLP